MSFKIKSAIQFTLPLALIISSCEEEIKAPAPVASDAILVVEALFTNAAKSHTVRLSRTQKLNSSEVPQAVSGATVTISDGTNQFNLVEQPSGSGIYQTNSSVKGEIDKTYTLSIQTDGKIYTASDKMIASLSPDPIQYKPSTLRQGFYEWTVPKDYSVNPGETYESRIKFIPPEGSSIAGQREVEIVYYNFTGLEISTLLLLNEPTLTILIEPGTTIIQTRYSLTPGYYEFLKAIYTETDWKGGLYDSTPANAPTNLSGGAFGYFQVSPEAELVEIIN